MIIDSTSINKRDNYLSPLKIYNFKKVAKGQIDGHICSKSKHHKHTVGT